MVRILEKKKIVGHKTYGRTHQYFPLIFKGGYTKQSTRTLVDNYFSGSFESMVSFFVKEKDISVDELEKIMKELKKSKS
ncbi:MAG: BlaI/MecI/CopY family transcriptional regulator [Crocinitomicaceae bacterium]|nr:BlaI/MecI/CopY family transcriptional regulator [Crocinitomicaceae bacterium]